MRVCNHFQFNGMEKQKFHLAVEKTIPIFTDIGKYTTKGMRVYFIKSLLRYSDSFPKGSDLRHLLRSLAFVVKLRDYECEHVVEDTIALVFDVTPHYIGLLETMVDSLEAELDSKKKVSL